jgi:hypothetical protein
MQGGATSGLIASDCSIMHLVVLLAARYLLGDYVILTSSLKYSIQHDDRGSSLDSPLHGHRSSGLSCLVFGYGGYAAPLNHLRLFSV